MSHKPRPTRIFGESPALKEMLKMIERVAVTKTNVLVIGESGTGKELVARMIHDAGPLAAKPFVPVNCGAIPETLIESEMFGHRRGSFTGAVSEKMGLFEAAHGGTLFLDEVGELPLSMQVKLLRAIQERSFRKVGGTEDIRVDVRIIAATNRDLEAAVAKGTFREDLYYRLNVILIKTPPLRQRGADVLLLAEQFLRRCGAKYKNCPESFEAEVLEAFKSYDWPGNVRELENVVERAATLQAGSAGPVKMDSLPPGLQAIATRNRERAVSGAFPGLGEPQSQAPAPAVMTLPAPDFSKGPMSLDEILGDVEKAYLLAALAHAGGVKKKAASLLGITFRSIRYRLAKLGMDAGKEGFEDGGSE